MDTLARRHYHMIIIGLLRELLKTFFVVFSDFIPLLSAIEIAL